MQQHLESAVSNLVQLHRKTQGKGDGNSREFKVVDYACMEEGKGSSADVAVVDQVHFPRLLGAASRADLVHPAARGALHA